MALLLRDLREEDEGFVLSSWCKSFKSSYAAGVIPNHRYHAIYGEVVQGILSREGIQVVVAEETESGLVIGWCCAEDGLHYLTRTVDGHKDHGVVPILHYVYVKLPYRRLGIARELLDRTCIDLEAPFLYTFESVMGPRLAAKFPTGRHDPVVARNEKNVIFGKADRT